MVKIIKRKWKSDKNKKIIVEDGEKKKVIKIIKVMEDGSKQIETVKEIVEE